MKHNNIRVWSVVGGEICLWAAAAMATLALWSWLAGVPDVFAYNQRHVPTAPLTALLLLLGCWSIFLLRRPHEPAALRLAGIMTLILTAVGGWVVVRHGLGWRSPVEEWLGGQLVSPDGIPLGQMAAYTGILLLVLAALLGGRFLRFCDTANGQFISRLLAGLLVLGGLLVLVMYSANHVWTHGRHGIPMAAWTAVIFLLIGAALLAPPPAPRRVTNHISLKVGTLLALLIALIGALYLRHEQADIRNQSHEMLKIVAELKAKEIAQWRQERLSDAKFFANARFVVEEVRQFLELPETPGLRAELLHWLNLLKSGSRYERVAIYDTNLNLRLEVADSPAPPGGRSAPIFFPSSLGANPYYMSDFHRHEDDTEIHLSLHCGLRLAETNPPFALLIMQINPHTYLYPLIQNWPIPGETAETLLVRREGNDVVFLNELRHRTNTALNLRLPLADYPTLPAALAAQGHAGEILGRDYRGRSVLASVLPVPDSSWLVVAKVDLSEIYAPLRRASWLVLLVTVGLGGVAGLLARLVWQRQRLSEERERRMLAERVEHLMKGAYDAILVLDAAGGILDANERAIEFYGRSLDELKKLSVRDLRPPSAQANFAAHFQAALETGQSFFETEHQRRDGTVFPVEVSSRAVDLAGQLHVLSIIRNIAQRKIHEREIQRLNRLYATLSQVNQAVVRARTREELFQEICRIAIEFGQFKLAWIGWVDQSTQRIMPVASAGPATAYLNKIVVYADDRPEGRGPAGRSVRSGKAEVSNEFDHDPNLTPWHAAAATHGLKSCLAVPLRRNGEICGLLVVYATEADYFHNREIALLEETALDVSFAIDYLDGEAQRCQVEQALRENEERLRLALRAAQQGLFDLNVQTGEARVSPEYALMIGHDPATFVETNARWIERLHPEDHEPVANAYRAYIRGELPEYRVEFRQRTKAGHWKWILSQGSIVEWDAQGAPRRMLGTHTDITERKQMELALRENEERLRLAMEAANMGLWDRDLNTNELHWSTTEERLMGYEPGTFPGTNEAFVQLIHPDSTADHETAKQRVRSGDGVFQAELRFRRADGRERWGFLCGKRLLDDDGKPVRIIGVDLDITERKRAEAALALSERNYREIFNATNEAIVISDTATGRFLDVNEAMLRLFGYDEKAELLPKTVGDLSANQPPYTEEKAREHLQRAVAEGPQVFEWLARRKDGSRFWIEISLRSSTIAGESRILTVARDITERKLAEKILHQRIALQEQMAKIAATVPGVIYSFRLLPDGGMCIPFASPAIENIFGLRPDQVIEDFNRYFELIHPDDHPQMIASIQESARQLTVWHCEFRVQHPQKGELWIEGHSLPQREPDGSTLWHGFVYDVTGRKQAEKELAAERNLLRALFDHLPDLIFIKNATGQVVQSNAAAAQYLGLSEEQLRGKSVFDVNPADLAQGYELDDQRVLRRGETIANREEQIRDHAGALQWHLTTKAPLRDPAGRVTGLIAICRNIHERRLGEMALRENRRFLANVIEHSGALVSVKDREGRYEMINRRWEEVTGLSRHFTLGRLDVMIFPAASAQQFRANDTKVIESNTVCEFEETLDQPGGQRHFVTTKFPLCDEAGQATGVCAMSIEITGRKAAEQALRENQRFLADLIENSGTVIFVKDRAGRHQLVNRKWEEITGLKRSQMLGKSERDLLPAPMADQFRRHDLQVMEQEQVLEFEETFHTPEGPRHFISTKFPLRDHEGKVSGVCGIATDITERRQMELQLRESVAQAQLFREALDRVPAYIYTKDRQARYLYANRPTLELFRCSAAELPGADDRQFFPPDTVAKLHAVDARVLAGEQTAEEIEVRDKDGQRRYYFEVKTPTFADATGQTITGLLGISTDITERKQAEEEQLRLLNILESTVNEIYVFDGLTLRFQYVNPAALDNLGYSVAALRSMTPVDIKPEFTAAKFEELVTPLRRHEQASLKYLTVHRRVDETLYPVEVHLQYQDQFVPPVFLAVVLDITERMRIEAERDTLELRLRHQQKLEAIGTLAAGVAHEINNPINGIMNYAQLIADDVPPGGETAEFAGKIMHEVERVAVIIRNLLRFARHDRQEHSAAKVQDIVQDTLSLIRTVMRHDQIQLEVTVPAGLPTIKCRSQQIQQVLMNLLTNARDALNEKYPAPHPDKILRLWCELIQKAQHRWLRITVEDHGIGIPPEEQERIFEPFYTTKPRDHGTGLGLSISHTIVREHHGQLWVESIPHQFTRFHVEIPVDNGWESPVPLEL